MIDPALGLEELEAEEEAAREGTEALGKRRDQSQSWVEPRIHVAGSTADSGDVRSSDGSHRNGLPVLRG